MAASRKQTARCIGGRPFLVAEIRSASQKAKRGSITPQQAITLRSSYERLHFLTDRLEYSGNHTAERHTAKVRGRTRSPEGPSPDGPEPARHICTTPACEDTGPPDFAISSTKQVKATHRSTNTLHQNTKEHKRGLHSPIALPFPSSSTPPLLSINKNGTIHAGLKGLQSQYVIARDTWEKFKRRQGVAAHLRVSLAQVTNNAGNVLGNRR